MLQILKVEAFIYVKVQLDDGALTVVGLLLYQYDLDPLQAVIKHQCLDTFHQFSDIVL